MIKTSFLAPALLLLTLFCSCVTYKRSVYMQADLLQLGDSITYQTKPEEEYIVRTKDILYIKVYNINDVGPEMTNPLSSGSVTQFSMYFNGYLVDDSGYVEIPQMTKIKVADMTFNEAVAAVKKRVHEQLPYSIVVVKPIFKISVLGEVKMPGVLYISNVQLTLFEALGYAGDLTDYGNRKKIKLIRTEEGIKKMVMLDLTDPAIMESEYFFIKPNDVIYVEPFKAKFVRINSTNITLAISVITLAFLTYTIFKK